MCLGEERTYDKPIVSSRKLDPWLHWKQWKPPLSGFSTLKGQSNLSLQLNAKGGSAKINSLEVHGLKSAWTSQ